jgi:hypothetical protein
MPATGLTMEIQFESHTRFIAFPGKEIGKENGIGT